MGDSTRGLALNVDLYELTMAAAYFEAGLNTKPTFELFVRKLPPRRSYLLVAGLAQALEYLSSLQFTGSQIDYIRSLPPFKTVGAPFFDYLASLRFRGEVWAMPEGTVAFENEPLLRVTADIIEAQIIETYLLATVNFQTMVATKASRVVAAAGGKISRPPESLEDIVRRTAESLSRLPQAYMKLDGADRYPVRMSEALKNLRSRVRRRTSD